MVYQSRWLQRWGQVCTVTHRGTVATTDQVKIALKPPKASAVRNVYWEGIVLDSAISSGDTFRLGDADYIVVSTNGDPVSGVLGLAALRANASLVLQQEVEAVDAAGNITSTWETVFDGLPAYGEIVTSDMRRFDLGLLDNSKYLFSVPKWVPVSTLNRLVYNEANYEVVSIDDIAFDGVYRLQARSDTR